VPGLREEADDPACSTGSTCSPTGRRGTGSQARRGSTSFVPLPEILGEIAGVGPKSKSVTAQVSAMVDRFGPELGILGDVPLDDLAAGAPSIVAEAITRLRRARCAARRATTACTGTIRLFDPDELAGAALFDVPKAAKPARTPAPDVSPESRRPSKPSRQWRRCSRRALTRSSTRSSPTTADPCSSWRDLARARPGCSRTRSRTDRRRSPARALPGRHVHPPCPRRAPRPPRRAARRGRRRAGHGRPPFTVSAC